MIRNTRRPKKRRPAKTSKRRPRPKQRAGAKMIAKRSGKTRRRRQPPSPATPADAIESLIAASAQALGLPLDPAWHGGIKFNLSLILRLAALVDEFPLPNDAEPAPVFHA